MNQPMERNNMTGNRILLGITGGIAAYKIPLLVRLLVKAGHEVQGVMTKAAAQFVTPLTLTTLSGNPVYQDMWAGNDDPTVDHISLADRADLAVVAPATANFIGKAAAGIADDMLSTVILAVRCPILICPSMNPNMFQNPVVQRNLATLVGFGYHIMEPTSGELACGWEGTGRLPEPQAIADEIGRLLSQPDLPGVRVLVTAGPTEEPLDPVRFLSNRSSGKMGVAIAARARARGADVTLVAGPLKTPVPGGLRHIPVRTAWEMHDAVVEEFAHTDVVIKAAAVSDYRPAEQATEKIKRNQGAAPLKLVENPDIIKELGSIKRKDQVLVGFAAETNNALQNGIAKIEQKNLDMLVLNDVTKPGAGFQSDTNIITFLHRDGTQESFELMPKSKVADLILDRVLRMLESREIRWK